MQHRGAKTGLLGDRAGRGTPGPETHGFSGGGRRAPSSARSALLGRRYLQTRFLPREVKTSVPVPRGAEPVHG